MSHIEQLIGRQIELCEIRRRLEAEHRQPASGAPQVSTGPCVLISREHGSQGGRLAQLVGEHLGWKVFDREIVEEVARHAHVRNRLIESIDEPVRSQWRYPAKRRKTEEEIGRGEYLYFLQQVLLALGHHGSAIILGRGAHLVLPADRCARVRVVAPLSQRIQRVADREHLSLAEAQRLVETVDAERAAFVRVSFDRDLAAAADYDLVVNTGAIAVEAAANLVLTLVRHKLGVEPLEGSSCAT